MPERAPDRIAILSARLGQIDMAWSEHIHQLSDLNIARNEHIRQLSDLDVQFKTKSTECSLLLIASSLASISSLPNEILASIFQIVCRSASFEITMSHVTRRWREVALGTPVLWTRIHRAKYAEHPEELQKAAAYLLRSQRLPIQLVVEIGTDIQMGRTKVPRDQWNDQDYGDNTMSDEIDAFCKLITPHLMRCNRVSVSGMDWVQGRTMLEFLSSVPLPMLSSIRVHYEDGTIVESDPKVVFENNAPSLTHICLSGQPNLHCTPPLSITTLRLELDNFIRQQDHLLALSNSLASMPLLNHLELDNALYWPPTQLLILPALRTLSCPVKDFATDDASSLLLALNAPSLQETRVGFRYEVDKTLALRGSSNFPSLVRLYLTGDSPTTSISSVQKLSEAFPSLVDITYTGYTRQFIVSFRHLHDNNIGVWPQLESLGIETWDNEDDSENEGDSEDADDGEDEEFPVAELQDLLVRRSQIGCPVRKLLLPKANIPKGAALISCLRLPIALAELLEPVSPFPDDSLESGAEIRSVASSSSY